MQKITTASYLNLYLSTDHYVHFLLLKSLLATKKMHILVSAVQSARERKTHLVT